MDEGVRLRGSGHQLEVWTPRLPQIPDKSQDIPPYHDDFRRRLGICIPNGLTGLRRRKDRFGGAKGCEGCSVSTTVTPHEFFALQDCLAW